jgi:DNA polymerase III epsilon subunit-like protein/thymidine kinase
MEKENKKFSLAPLKDYFEKIIHNEEQLKFIHAPIESCSLNGIPGGGKTQSIISKISYLFLTHQFTKTSDYKLFTFSKRACSDFITKGKKHHSRIFQSGSIQTIHSLSGKLLYHITKKKSSSKNSVIMCALYLFDKHSAELKDYAPLKDCKVIFVDEAQDISDIQYKLIMKISDFYKIPVIMIGDPNQNIYQFQNGSDKYLLEHKGPKYYLIKNYRSTPPIVNLVNSIRPWDNLTPKMISARYDEDSNPSKITSFVKRENQTFHKPHIIVDNIQNIITNVMNKIKNLGIPYEEIAIIGPVKKSKPNADYYTNIGLSLFTNLLLENKIPYIKHYQDGDGEGGDDIDKDIYYKSGHINLFTIHGSKGLEFKAVFLLNFHLNTFGMSPTEEDYNRFKYLWYVGLSRASDYLYIYVDERKYAWYDLKSVRLEDVIYETKFPKLIQNLEFKEEIRPLSYGVTEILRNKKYMNDRLYHYFYEAIGEKQYVVTRLWEQYDLPESYEVDNMDFYKIYGIFMEHIFNFYYHYDRKIAPDFVTSVEKIIKNTIELPKKYSRGYGILKVRLPQITKECITLSMINTYKNILSKSEMEMYSYLCIILDDNYHKEFYLQPENSVISYPRERLLEKISFIYDYLYNVKCEEHDENFYLGIFEMAIFQYQCENESAYLWKSDFTKYVKQLAPHILHISQFARNLYKENKEKGEVYKFHERKVHSNLPLNGEFDMINQNALVDLKFSQSSMDRYVDQLLMYYMLYDPTLQSSISLELWNILKGEKVTIVINRANIKKVIWLQVLCRALNQKLRNMVFIYDLETTGLYYTNRKVDIIERHVEDYGTRSVWSYGLVKPENIPFIPFEITQLTGITKEMVFSEGEDIGEMKAEFENIFKYCEKPIFIAHNGNAFDHKILFEKEMLKEHECICIDSRYLLRLLIDNPQISERKLEDIYKYYCDEVVESHRASSDVYMLIKIFEKLGLKSSDLEKLS